MAKKRILLRRARHREKLRLRRKHKRLYLKGMSRHLRFRGCHSKRQFSHVDIKKDVGLLGQILMMVGLARAKNQRQKVI